MEKFDDNVPSSSSTDPLFINLATVQQLGVIPSALLGLLEEKAFDSSPGGPAEYEFFT
jgi:hypothetical protein